jgi:hypothetical protein
VDGGAERNRTAAGDDLVSRRRAGRRLRLVAVLSWRNALARKGVVLVTVNHWLGVRLLGFPPALTAESERCFGQMAC